jgi:hypothetical protein
LYFKKKGEEVGDMETLIQKIGAFLRENPNSNARSICKEIGADKSAVNKCLYSNEGKHFLKEGLTPPLWRNINESSQPETVEIVLTETDEDRTEDNFEIKDAEEFLAADDWTDQDSKKEQAQLVIKALMVRAVKMNKKDRSRINQLINQIQQSVRNDVSAVERAEQKLKNRSDYFAMIDSEINEAWSVEEQREHAVAALRAQFESNLRRLAYGFLISSRDEHSQQENEGEIGSRSSNANNLIESFSSTISTRLSNLEDMSDDDLIKSSVRFGWINRNRVERTNSQSATEMVPHFEEIEKVKAFRSRFHDVAQRIIAA